MLFMHFVVLLILFLVLLFFARAVGVRERQGLGVPNTLRSDFFREEYVLDYRLAEIAKEQVICGRYNTHAR